MPPAIYKTLLLGSLFLLLAGCESFLDREPLDQIIEENYYETAEDARRAVLSVYAPMQGVNWYGKSWMLTEIPTDNSTAGGNDPDFSPIDNFTTSPDNIPISEFWSEHYRLIAFANQVLEFVPPIEMDETTKNSVLGEARFLRAFAYFDLVRIFGAVPIIEKIPEIDTDVNVSRNSVAEVYDFLLEDLRFAVDNLTESYTGLDQGRATVWAAKALLMKVYLTQKKWDDSMDLARDIIANGPHSLMENFDDNWLKESSDNNKESIFQIQYAGCGPIGTGNALQAFFAPWGEGITKNSDGWGSQIPTSPQIDNPGTTVGDLFTEGDLRIYHTIMKGGTEYPMINAEDGGYTYPTGGASRGGINIKKYVIGGGSDVCFMTTPQNVHVIRYADVLLSLAEAACGKNGGITVVPDAIDAFNAVRQRAGQDLVESVIDADMVLEERRKEFAFENQRWFDLLRSGKIKEIMLLHGKSFQDFHVLFPLPSDELAINPNLTQNPGY